MPRTIVLPLCLGLLLPAAAAAAGRAKPASDAADYAAAIELDRAGRKDEAAEQLRAALKIKPDSVPYLNMLGSLYYDLGKYDLAAKNLEAAGKYDPKKVWHYYLSMSLYKLGRLEEARKAAKAGIPLEPQKGRKLVMIKLAAKIKGYQTAFAAAKSAFAKKDHDAAASAIKNARALVETEEAKKLEEEVAGIIAARELGRRLAAAREALAKGDLAAARGELEAARGISDAGETKSLDAELAKAETFQKHMARADAMLKEGSFKEAKEAAAEAIMLFPREEVKQKIDEINKAEKNYRYRFHLDQAKAFLANEADYAAALGECRLALEISDTEEAGDLMADIAKMQADRSYKRHYVRAGELLAEKDYDGALAEFGAAAAIVKTEAVEAKIAEAAKLRGKARRNRLLFGAASGLGFLAALFGTVKFRLGRRKANDSLAALAGIIDAMKLSDFRKAMLEYSNFKKAGGRPEDIPSAELFALFSGSGAAGRLNGENVSAGYLLDCALQLAGKNRAAEAFLVLGEGAVLGKIESPADFEAFINIYLKAGRLPDIGALLERGGFSPEIYSGLAAALYDLRQNEQGIRVLQAKRRFHELQKIDSDLLFAFTKKE
ncbi:MAG: hypothetical protein HY550_10615 [Elusimicrobia bacterium]|nr:hypothetical protein [Elusimicrobiota bacterium]